VGILNGEIIGWPHPCTGSYHEVSVTGLDWITERTCTTPGAFFHSFLSPRLCVNWKHKFSFLRFNTATGYLLHNLSSSVVPPPENQERNRP